jgi:hypothetical protein
MRSYAHAVNSPKASPPFEVIASPVLKLVIHNYKVNYSGPSQYLGQVHRHMEPIQAMTAFFAKP